MDVIRSVGNDHLRQTLLGLKKTGWDITKTSGGHLKLLHPDAAYPVHAPATPSDRRSTENLKSQCRRALVEEGTETDVPTDCPEEFDQTLRTRKQEEKHMSRISGTLRMSSSALATASATNAPFENSADDLFFERHNGTEPPPGEPIEAKRKRRRQPRKRSQRTPAQPPANQAPVGEGNSMPHPTPRHSPAGATPETDNADSASMNGSTGQGGSDGPNRQDDKPLNAYPQIEKDTSAPDLTSIPPEALRLAMQIASGEARTIHITPKMVGGTLCILSDGSPIFIAPESSSSPEKPASVTHLPSDPKPEPRAQPCVKSAPEQDAAEPGHSAPESTTHHLVMEALSQWSHGLTVSEIYDLIEADANFKNRRSGKAAVYGKVQRLVREGIVEETEVNTRGKPTRVILAANAR